MAKKTINLESDLLGLNKTLEDEILDVINGCIKESIKGQVDLTINSIPGQNLDKQQLDNYIKNVVYDVLKQIFGYSFIPDNARSFKQRLFSELEREGFVRDCPTCAWNTKRLGKIEK